MIEYLKMIIGTGFIGFFIYHLNQYLKLKKSDELKVAYRDIEKQKSEIKANVENKNISDLISSSHELADKIRSRK